MQNKKEKIVFLDFCGTCVPFQSADRFVQFVISHYATIAVRCRSVLLKILVKLRLVKRIERWSKQRITTKKLILFQIKGLSKKVIDEAAEQYFLQIIKPALIPEIMDEIKAKMQDGYRIVIVSGGYDVYIRYFMNHIGGKADDVLATPLIFVNGIFTGKMGLDCMGENKVSYIRQHFDFEKIYSIAYSDSPTDMPLFEIADKAYFVVNLPIGTHQNINTLIYRR